MEEVFNLVNMMSPYLLLGFLFAGILHAFIPGAVYSRYLSGHGFRSVFYATLLGIPLPLCSCGVIPTAMSLRREGASKGAAVSFLIATPETGLDSIAATYSLMGLPFAIVRPITAFFTSLMAGSLVNAFDKSPSTPATTTQPAPATPEHSGDCCDEDRAQRYPSFWSRVKGAMQYAFVDMLGDIGKWLLIGLLVAGLITVFVPDTFFETFKGNTFLSMLLVLCIAIPMYVCATGSIPIAVALIMKGLTPGAALVLLMAGPACNMASILVINKVLGRRTLCLYLASIISGAIIAGTIIDQLPTEWFLPTLMSSACCEEEGLSWINYGSTILLALLFLNVLWRRLRHPHDHCHCHDHAHGHSHAHNHDTPNIKDNTMTEFYIKGMNCSHCQSNAVKALKSLPGVTDAKVDLATGKAQVSGSTSMEAIREAIESLGFSVKD